ncbi:MAG: DNA/RNA non-specific endonuclease [Paracoccaceae bacterium]
MTEIADRSSARDVPPPEVAPHAAPGAALGARPEALPNPAASQARLTDYAALGERRQHTSQQTVTPERRAEIDAYVSSHARATEGDRRNTDQVGGTRVGEALLGRSDLGELTPEEREYMAQEAVGVWSRYGARENITEAVQAVQRDAAATRALAKALSEEAAAADFDAQDNPPVIASDTSGQTWQERRERAKAARAIASREDFVDHIRQTAFEADPLTAARAYEGREDILGREVMNMSPDVQRDVLVAVANRQINGEGADRLVSSMFVYAQSGDMEDPQNQRAFADALAMTAQPATHPTPTAERQIISNRLAAVLGEGGAHNLLLSKNVQPEVRGWALENVMGNGAWNADTLSDAWESDIVTAAFGEQTAAQYAARGTEGQLLTDDALLNTVGQAISERPSELPPEDETSAAREARLAAGLDHRYYGNDTRAATIARNIEELGGGGARVSVVPVSVTSNEFGVAAFNVFRVERADGSVGFVDDQGRKYDDFDDWTGNEELPQGQMTYPAGLEPGAALIDPKATRGVVDTNWERFGQVLDWAAVGVGVVAGAAIVVGTGGTAAILAAGAAGAYTAGTAGADLYEDHQRGLDVLDFSNPENRSRWLEVAAGTLSVGAIGSGIKVANAARNGAQVSQTLSRTAAGLAVAADTADAVAMGDQALQMVQNWDQMSNADRAMGMLNLAFWGGMGVASARAGGGDLRDAFSFTRLDNTFRTGTPYPMTEVSGLAPGEIRVAYNESGGRARDIRIETGGDVAPVDLARHTETARQIEAAGGMHDRLRAILGDEPPTMGTAPWEARLELQKIDAEARAIADELTRPDLSPDRVADLEARQRDLNRAINRQTERINDIGDAGRGWIGAPSRGTEQAEALGWADAPDGYAWVGGDDGQPVLFGNDGKIPVHEFDPIRGEFTERYRRGESGSLNPELNPPPGAANRAMGLEPNNRIEYDNGHAFETNAEGHVSRVEADLTDQPPWVRDSRSQAAYGNLGQPARDFDGGHLIARMFGGSPDRINVVPMDSTLNQRGPWRQLEQSWEARLDAGQSVQVEIDVTYPPGGGTVPQSFRVVETIDGVTGAPQTIWNTSNGQRPGAR